MVLTVWKIPKVLPHELYETTYKGFISKRFKLSVWSMFFDYCFLLSNSSLLFFFMKKIALDKVVYTSYQVRY